jgi:hypothetical protein
MANHIAILDDSLHIFARLAIDGDVTRLNGILVIISRSISELRCENVKKLSVTPSLLAESIVCKVVGGNSAQASREVVWPRPRVAWGDRDSWRRCRRGVRVCEREVIDAACGQGHAGRWVCSSPGQIGEDARRIRQRESRSGLKFGCVVCGLCVKMEINYL